MSALVAGASVLDVAPADAQEIPRPITLACRCSCLSSIGFPDGTSLDRLAVHAGVAPGTSIDPTSEAVLVELSNAGGTIFSETLAPGQISDVGGTYTYANPLARIAGGITRLRISNRRGPDGGFRVDVFAYGNFAATATLAEMTLRVVIGDDPFFITTTWMQTPRGWAVQFPV